MATGKGKRIGSQQAKDSFDIMKYGRLNNLFSHGFEFRDGTQWRDSVLALM